MRMIAATFAIVIAVGGCATGYQPTGFSGGYSEVQLNADTYQIRVRGNGYTSTDRAQNIALLRASELTLAAGADRFVVLGGGTSSSYAGSTGGSAYVVGNTLITDSGSPIYKPSSGLIIRIVRKGDPAYAGALDAKMIDAQLRPNLT